MRITPITTHEADALNRLLFQYKGKENLENLIKDLYTTRAQALENGLLPLYNRLNIDLSEGVQLDGIGQIVGQLRLGLSDSFYRIFLKARIGVNVSEGDIARVIDVWKLMTNSNIVQLLEAFPAEVDLYYDVPLDDDLAVLAFSLIQDVVGAGIGVGFAAVFENGNAFALDGDVVGDDGTIDVLQGLGGALSQGTNTSISANKLIDSGATFQSDGVDNTMIVYNTSDDTVSDIVSVDSETELTLSDNIFFGDFLIDEAGDFLIDESGNFLTDESGVPKEYYVNENTGGKLAYLQAP